MSATDYSQVIAGTGFVIPPHPALLLRGPDTLYRFSQGQTAVVEAVTFQMGINGVLDRPVRFRLELTDPSGNVLYQNTTATLTME